MIFKKVVFQVLLFRSLSKAEVNVIDYSACPKHGPSNSCADLYCVEVVYLLPVTVFVNM